MGMFPDEKLSFSLACAYHVISFDGRPSHMIEPPPPELKYTLVFFLANMLISLSRFDFCFVTLWILKM